MDQDGLFLILSMCNSCRTGKGSWKKCMGKRHNPRLSTISHERLSFAHRQCVKPDQTMTIYKLRNHETNEEFLEFAADIVFQTPCADCSNIKACLKAGHRLADWQPILPDRVPEVKPQVGNDCNNGGGEKDVGLPSPASPSKGTGASTSRGRKGAAAASGGGKGGSGQGKVGGKGTPPGAGRGSATTGDVAPSPKGSHKRKSPGAATTPPTKNSKVSTPRSSGPSSTSSQGKASRLAAKEKPAKRAAKDRHSFPSGGKSNRKMNGNGHASGAAPVKSEPVDHDDEQEEEVGENGVASDTNERPLKRRGKGSTAAVAVPKQEEASSSTPSGDENDEHVGGIGLDNDQNDRVPSPPPPPPRELTIAEKLEAAKVEEAELLKEFRAMHDKCAKDEAAKRAEIEAFQKAGEAAIREIRQKKEEALLWISARRKSIAAERETLVQRRIKELEAEQAEARKQAQEREAKLQAEKEALAKAVSGHDETDPIPSTTSDTWLNGDSTAGGSASHVPAPDADAGSTNLSSDVASTAGDSHKNSNVDVKVMANGDASPADVMAGAESETQSVVNGMTNGVKGEGHGQAYMKGNVVASINGDVSTDEAVVGSSTRTAGTKAQTDDVVTKEDSEDATMEREVAEPEQESAETSSDDAVNNGVSASIQSSVPAGESASGGGLSNAGRGGKGLPKVEMDICLPTEEQTVGA